MSIPNLRAGRIAVQSIIVGTSVLIGGASSIPWFIPDRDPAPQSAIPATEMSMLPLEYDAPTSEETPPLGTSAEASSDADDIPMAIPLERELSFSATALNVSKANPQPKRVQVFYATDRQIVRWHDCHLWITSLVPGVLGIAITGIVLSGCFIGNRRWAWALGTGVCCLLTFYVVGQSFIKVGQLIRLAHQGSAWFGNSRYESGEEYPLHLGTSLITLPKDHHKGVLERPSVFQLEFQEDEDLHVMVQRIQELDTDSFFMHLQESINSSADRSGLIYIHGFNVKFDEALRRTAQIASDIEFKGAPILYSWPSQGSLLKYRFDESNVEWSVAHLERFLSDVHERTGLKKLHVIAHSMGNRALVGALQLLQLRHPAKQPMLNQVILAAPDLDADVFRDRYADAVHSTAKRVTLYASATDRALLASMRIHGHRRLGLTSVPQPTVFGVDLVDVTPVDTSLLGHSYYGSHPLMIRELVSLILDECGPEQRSWLTTLADQRVPPLWRFVPELASKAQTSY